MKCFECQGRGHRSGHICFMCEGSGLYCPDCGPAYKACQHKGSPIPVVNAKRYEDWLGLTVPLEPSRSYFDIHPDKTTDCKPLPGSGPSAKADEDEKVTEFDEKWVLFEDSPGKRVWRYVDIDGKASKTFWSTIGFSQTLYPVGTVVTVRVPLGK